MHQENKHQSVLLDEVLSYLDPKEQESYLDLTAGYGGHALEVLKKTKAPFKAVLVDRDKTAISHLAELFSSQKVKLINQDFLSASRQLADENNKFDLILADLGVSSPHLNNKERGFSLSQSGPLDMRMDQSAELSAHDIVNKYSVDRLAKLILDYGQEPSAYKIAKAIASSRPISTTGQLAEVIVKSLPKPRLFKKSKIHPATRTFQAIRIAVNDELNQLEHALPLWFELLNQGGRIVIISFHSLEDRLVKQAIAQQSGNRYDATLKLLTKKPVTAGQQEIVFNPRARSAKLRAAVKIKTEGD
jgi:16S rRNA (cytosine1402-N4)-methyltransferase